VAQHGKRGLRLFTDHRAFRGAPSSSLAFGGLQRSPT
jgi:hypothetical protein